MPSVELIGYNGNYEQILTKACSMPYGNNVTMKGVQAIVNSGHVSVIEHCNAIFHVKCSVRVLGQITRHRHLHFTVKSARGCRFTDMVIPEGLKQFYEERGREIKLVVMAALREYNYALDMGVAEEDAAYLLPEGIETELVVSGNFRAWLEYLPKRLCRRAMPEHRELADLIHKELIKAIPEIFDVNLMNCGNCKERSCEFK